MSSTNIQIAIKVRPFIEREKREKLEPLWLVKENSIVQIDCQKNFIGEPYSFDHIFDETKSNNTVYNSVVKPLVLSCLEGINSTIFAYGQTSSGKTHTMLGDQCIPGIISFTVQDIFAHIGENTTKNFLLRCSYLEIYNEKINDLLDTNAKDIKIREDYTQGVYVVVKEEVIREPEELFTLMKRGMKTRKIGCTDMNERSSRSHTIFKLVIQSQCKDSEGSYTESTLNLVDLAGSERVGQMNLGRERQVEGVSINKSLTTLGLVIRKLSEGEQYINYRDSKLTRLLQHSLGGNSRTLIIATITVAASEETKSTLDFAQRAKYVKNRPIINERVTDKDQLKQYEHLCEDYKEQIEKLRLEKIERDKTINALEGKISSIKLFTAGNVEKMAKPNRIPHRRHTLGHYKPLRNISAIMDTRGLEVISDDEDLEDVFSPVRSEIGFHFSNEDDKENYLLYESVCSSQSKEVVPQNPAIPVTPSPNLRREKELLEESYHNLKSFTNLEKQLQGETDELEELRELTERLRDENFNLREDIIKRDDSFIQLKEGNKDIREKLLILRTILEVKPFEDIRRKSLHTIEEEGIELFNDILDSSVSSFEAAEDLGEIKTTNEANKKYAAIIEENQHLKRQINEKERIIDELSTEKINKETVCAKLDEENKNLKNQIDLKVAAINKLNITIREHQDVKEAELEILGNKIKKLTDYKEEMHKKLSELQKVSSGKEDDVQRLLDQRVREIANLQRENERLEQHLDKNATLEQTVQTYLKDIETLQIKCEYQKDEINELRNQLHNKINELDEKMDITLKFNTKVVEYESLTNENEQLRKELNILSDMQRLLDQRVREIANLQRENERLEQHLDKNATLEQTVQTYLKDIETLQIKCEYQKDEINELRNQLHNKINELDEKMDITSKFNTKVVEYESLTNENEQLRKELNILSDMQNEKLEEKLDVNQLKKINEDIIKQLNEKNNIISEHSFLKEENERLKSELQDTVFQLSGEQNELEKMCKELDEKTRNIEALEQIISSLKNNRNEQMKKLEEINGINLSLREDIVKKEEENIKLKYQLQTNFSQNENLQEIGHLKKQLEHTAAELAEKSEVYDCLLTDYSKNNTMVKSLEKQIEELEDKLTKLNILFEKQLKEIDDLKREKEILIHRLDNSTSLEESVKSFTTDIQTLKGVSEKQITEIRELKDQLNLKINELHSKSESYNMIQIENEQHLKDIEVLKEDKQRLIGDNASLQKKVQSYLDDIQNLQALTEAQQVEINELNNQLNQLIGKNEKIIQNHLDDIQNLRASIEAQQFEINELKNQLHLRVSELTEKSLAYDAIRADNDEKLEAIQNLETEKNELMQSCAKNALLEDRQIENERHLNEIDVLKEDKKRLISDNASLQQRVQNHLDDIQNLRVLTEAQQVEISELKNQLHLKVSELTEKVMAYDAIRADNEEKLEVIQNLEIDKNELMQSCGNNALLEDIQADNERHLKDVEVLKEDKKRLISDNASLQQRVQNHLDDIQNLRVLTEAQQVEISELKNQLHLKVSELTEKVMAYDAIRADNEEKLEVIQNLEIDKNELMQSCGNNALLEDIQAENERHLKDVEVLKEDKKRLISDNSSLQQRVQNHLDDIQNLRVLTEAQQVEISELKNQLHLKVSELTEKVMAYDAIRADNEEKLEVIQNLEIDKNELMQSCGNNALLEDIQAENERHLKDIEVLKEDKKRLISDNASLQERVQNHLDDIQNLRASIEAQQFEINDSLQQRLQNHLDDNQNLRTLTEAQQVTINELKNQLHFKVSELTEKSLAYDAIRADNEEKLEVIQNLETEKNKWMQSCGKNALLEQNVQSYFAEIEILQSICEDKKSQIEKLKSQLYSKTTEVMEKSRSYNEIFSDYNKVMAENKYQLKVIENLEEEKIRLSQNVALLEQTVQSHVVDIQNLQSICENKKSEIEKIKSQLNSKMTESIKKSTSYNELLAGYNKVTAENKYQLKVIENLEEEKKRLMESVNNKDSLEKNIQSYLSEIKNLQATTKAQRIEIDELKNKIHMKTRELDEKTASYNHSLYVKEEHGSLMNENAELRKQLQAYSGIHQSSQERNLEKSKTSRFTDDIKLKIKESINFKDDETAGANKDLKQQLACRERRYVLLEAQFNTEKRKAESLSRKLLSSEREVVSLQAKVNYLTQQKKRIQESHSDKNPVSRLSDEGRPMSPNDLRKIKRQSIHDQRRGLTPDFGNLFDDEDLGCSECAKIKTILTAYQEEKKSEIDNLKKENKFLDKENEDMLKIIEDYEKNINELHENLDKFKNLEGCSKCAKLKTVLTACQEEKKSEIDDLKKENKFLDKENEDMLKIIEDYEKNINELHEKLNKFKNLEGVQNTLKEQEEAIQKYKEEIARLRSKIRQAELENSQANSRSLPKSEKGTQATDEVHVKYNDLKKILVLRRKEGNYLRARLNLPPDCPVLPEDLKRQHSQQKLDPLKDNAP